MCVVVKAARCVVLGLRCGGGQRNESGSLRSSRWRNPGACGFAASPQRHQTPVCLGSVPAVPAASWRRRRTRPDARRTARSRGRPRGHGSEPFGDGRNPEVLTVAEDGRPGRLARRAGCRARGSGRRTRFGKGRRSPPPGSRCCSWPFPCRAGRCRGAGFTPAADGSRRAAAGVPAGAVRGCAPK